MKCQASFSLKNNKKTIKMTSATLLYNALRVNEQEIIPLMSIVRKIDLCKVQSTLVISNSKGHSEILRDIRTSTYQICRIGGKTNSISHI